MAVTVAAAGLAAAAGVLITATPAHADYDMCMSIAINGGVGINDAQTACGIGIDDTSACIEELLIRGFSPDVVIPACASASDN
jgi:hypothetical protein